MASSLFAFAVAGQLLLLCLSPELASVSEKVGHRIIHKNNLGLTALAVILAVYVGFWVCFGPMMHSPEVNIVLGLLQLSSLYTAVVFWSKLRNDKVA